MKSCIAVITATVWLLSFLHQTQAEETPPNVLFIAVDDLNDWNGAMKGHPQAVTPNFDRLAETGMLFTNAHCAAPACNPSRAAAMTGIRPTTSGVYFNQDPWRKSPVLKDAKTIPQWFREQGYSVFGSGKIFHGGFPDPASWDFYWPSQQKNQPGNPKPEERPVNGIPKTAHFDWGPHPEGKEEMGDWKVAEWISGHLSKENDKPFFIACGFFRPHLPWYAPREYFDRFPLEEIILPKVVDDDLNDIPKAGLEMAKPDGDHRKVIKHAQWKQAVQGYLASIAFVDDCLGKVLEALEKGPHSDNTIVVLWGDHGWHLGEKQHWRKFALWEEATRVPLIIRTPSMKTAGSTTAAPVNLIDIYPTLLDLCGLPENPSTEGKSLVTLLENPTAPWESPSLTTHGLGNHSLRDGRWRYIRYADGSEELYDHAKDPGEHQNLAGETAFAAEKRRLGGFLPTEEAARIQQK